MYADQNWERMLDRAWKGVYDAVLMAEAQGRTYHTRKLKRAALIITEVQQDLLATSRTSGRGDWERRHRGRAGTGDSAID